MSDQELELKIKTVLNDLKVEVLILPIDNLTEAKQKLERKLSEVWVKEFSQFVSNFFIDNREQIEKGLLEREENMPTSISFEFNEQYNDEGGSDTYISYFYFHDKNDQPVDLDGIEISYMYKNWKDELVNDQGDLYEIIKEEIRDKYHSSDIEQYIGDNKVLLNIK